MQKVPIFGILASAGCDLTKKTNATERVLERVRTTVRKHSMFSGGGLVLVAVSGGPDSMCLLDVLARCRDDFGISLRVAHLNHRMRDQAPDDALMVTEFARSRGVETTVAEADVFGLAKELGMGLEEAGREARYRFFRSLQAETGATRVALGHNLNDQAETVLMRLFRGSGSRGLSGIPPVNGDIVRPIIDVPRELIEEYCAENRIPVMTDIYNLDLKYTRNQIRYKTLPELAEAFNPSLVDTLAGTASALRWDSEFLDEVASRAFQEHTCRWGRVTAVDIRGLQSLKPAIASRVVDMAWREASGTDGNLGFTRTSEVLDIPRAPVSLFGRVTVVRERDSVVFYPEPPSAKLTALKVPGETPIPELGITVAASILSEPDAASFVLNCEKSARKRGTFQASGRANSGPWLEKEDVAFLDYNKCVEPLTVRTRQEGDRFAPLGMAGSEQKLQDFFVQKRVPRFYRDFVPLFQSGDKIIWVGGFRLDDGFKVEENTVKVLRVEVRRELRCSSNYATI